MLRFPLPNSTKRTTGGYASQFRAPAAAFAQKLSVGLAMLLHFRLIATMTVSLVTNSRRSASFIGVLVLMVYLIFAMRLYLCRPARSDGG